MAQSKQIDAPYKSLRKDSLGNGNPFHETKRKRNETEMFPVERRTNEEILAKIRSYHFSNKCCERNSLHGCFLGAFQDESRINVDNNAAIQTFLCFNNKTRLKSDHERDQYLQELFLESIDEIRRNGDGDLVFSMKYQLFLNNRLRQVCRKVFAEAHGFTDTDFVRRSQAMKTKFSILDPECQRIPLKSELKLSSTYHRKWTDDHLHNFNFVQTQEIFRKNVNSNGIKFAFVLFLYLLMLIWDKFIFTT